MKIFNYMHMIEYDNVCFAYDIISAQMLEVSLEQKRLLNNLDDEIELNEMDAFAKKLIVDCLNAGILFSEEQIHVRSRKVDKISFSLPPEHICNLDCKYCFGMAGNNYKGQTRSIDKTTLIDIAKFLIEDYAKDIEKFRLDFVSGGEPLIDISRLIETIDTMRDEFSNANKKLDIWLCTNGTLLTPQIVKIFEKRDINIGVSLDGPAEIHNACRIYKNGSGSYNDAIAGIKYLMDRSVKASRIREPWISTVITNYSESFVKIIKHFQALGLKTAQLKWVWSTDDSEYSMKRENVGRYKEWVDELVTTLLHEAITGNISTWQMILNDNDYIGKVAMRYLNGSLFNYRCPAGRNKLAFTANGEIYPCDSFVGIDEFRLGSIYNGVDKAKQQMFEKLSVNDRSKCSKCWARYLCGGDCYYNSLLNNGDMHEADDRYCTLVKYAASKVLGSLGVLERKNQDVYLRLKQFARMRMRGRI